MATNNVKHKLSASSRRVINSGLTDDYRQAIVEYIWNGFDAEAKIVDIQYQKADELGNLAYLIISDNGKGIRRDLLEYTFGQLLDSQTFEKALANYTYVLDGKEKPEDVTIDNEQKNRRPDIFLARKRMVNDANTSSMLEDNIIVELKRPTVEIGIKEYRQIEDYFRLIKNDPKFNAKSRIWTLLTSMTVLRCTTSGTL